MCGIEVYVHVEYRVGVLAHRFFERFANFLWAKEQLALLSWATWVNRSGSLLCKKRRERFADSHTLVKSDVSTSLPPLCKKEWLSKEQHEWFALGHKKGEKQWKSANRSFFIAIRLNHEWITNANLLSWATSVNRLWSFFCHECSEGIAQGCSFVKSDESNFLMVTLFNEQREQIAHSSSLIWAILSKRANSQPW